MSLAKREKIMLAVLAGLAAVVGLYFLGDWYAKDVARLKSERDAKAADLQKVEEKVRDLANVEQKLAEARRLQEEYERLIPKDDELPQLLRDTANILTSAGVDLTTYTPGRPVPTAAAPDINQITVAISARGTYEKLLKMFQDLRAWHRLIGITNFSISRGGGSDTDPMLQCQFNMVVFFTVKR